MKKVEKVFDQNGKFCSWQHYCPGCKMHHAFDKRWSFNESPEIPSFSPSMLVRYAWGESNEERRCHYFLKDGKIQYLSDCTHELKGQTIECPNIEA
ncbi:MAG: DUF6527 family protein [Saonia sp.]